MGRHKLKFQMDAYNESPSICFSIQSSVTTLLVLGITVGIIIYTIGASA